MSLFDKFYKVIFVESNQGDFSDDDFADRFDEDDVEYRLHSISWPTPYQACLVYKFSAFK